MSSMYVSFSEDMPIAAIEILTPDHEIVTRRAMRPNSEATIEVPHETSFLRVHLPAGRAITMPRRDDLTYNVSLADLEGERGRSKKGPLRSTLSASDTTSVREVRSYQQQRSAAVMGLDEMGEMAWIDSAPPIEVGTDAESLKRLGVEVAWEPSVQGRMSPEGDEIAFQPFALPQPYQLQVSAAETRLTVSLPGMLESAYVRADDVGKGGTVVTVRAASVNSFADTAGGFMVSGDFYSAKTMTDWADQAEGLLASKQTDPFAATVAGYLLLRLERYDLMRDWARNLADWFPEMSDGCVIWALQLIRDRDDLDQANTYLEYATQRGWPVFTEGTRLLSESLRRAGHTGVETLRGLEKRSGQLLATSPFTAWVTGSGSRNEKPVSFDVGYEAQSY